MQKNSDSNIVREIIKIYRADPFVICKASNAYDWAEKLGMTIKGEELCYGEKRVRVPSVRFYSVPVPQNKYVTRDIKIPTKEIEESNGIANDIGFGVSHFVVALAEVLAGKKMSPEICIYPSSMAYAMEQEARGNEAVKALEEFLLEKV
jgi:hypothetical protein